jgi:hypothetical protein
MPRVPGAPAHQDVKEPVSLTRLGQIPECQLDRLAAKQSPRGWHKARRDAEMLRQGRRVEVIRGQLTDLLIKQNTSRLMRLAQNSELQDLHPAQITLVGADDETPEDIREAWKRSANPQPS